MTRDTLPRATADQHDIVGRHKRLVARTALISALTLCSRILGYVRESLTAVLFGDASRVYDSFVTAWRIPNLFRRLMGEGALSTSLQNTITKADGDRGPEAGRAVFLDTLALSVWILIGISALVMGSVLTFGDTLPFTNIRWLGEDPQALREFTLWLTPFLIFACLAGLCAGALGVRGHFASPSWGPALMNAIVIATLLGLWWSQGKAGAIADPAAEDARQLAMGRVLAIGTLVSGVALLGLQFPALRRFGLWPERNVVRRRDWAQAWSILKVSAPLALGAAVYQVNVVIDGWMAYSMLDTGGATALYYANRIQQFPLSLVATAATAAVYPVLNALGHRRELGALRAMHGRTQLAIAFVALPASLGLFVLARPIVSVLLEHGLFGAEGAERTAACMRWLALSVLPAGAVGLVSRTYYALGDLRTPVVVSIVMLAINVVLNFVFLRYLGMDCDGLTLATALCNWANLAWLLPPLFARLPHAPATAGERSPAARLTRMLACAALSSAAAIGVHRLLGGDPRSVLALVGAIMAGGATYALGSHLFGVEEWQHLLNKVVRRSQPRDDSRGR